MPEPFELRVRRKIAGWARSRMSESDFRCDRTREVHQFMRTAKADVQRLVPWHKENRAFWESCRPLRNNPYMKAKAGEIGFLIPVQNTMA